MLADIGIGTTIYINPTPVRTSRTAGSPAVIIKPSRMIGAAKRGNRFFTLKKEVINMNNNILVVWNAILVIRTTQLFLMYFYHF
jgi:hypothetical protein